MVRSIILGVGIILFFTGCVSSSPYRPTKPNELIQSESLSVRVPDDTFTIDKDYKGFYNKVDGLPGIYKTLNNTQYTIDFWVHPYKNAPIYNVVFNKDAEYIDSNKRDANFDAQDKEMSINYKKDWTVYVHGMRCIGQNYARNFGGTVYSAMSKNYSILCGYYDKEKGRRILDISYKYLYSGADTKLQGSNDTNNKKPLTQQEAEAGLKQALKAIIQTLHIKRFDKERMIEEGLYYPEKKFESTKW